MKTNEQTLEPQESLAIIQEMIGRAKKNYQHNSFYFLVWGALMCTAGIVEFILQHQMSFDYFWVVWPIAGTVGGVITGIHASSKRKVDGASSLVDKLLSYLWGGTIITLILLIFATVPFKLNPSPYILLLVGLPTFVSGMALGFKPLMIGGIVFWVIGMFSLFYLPGYTSLLYSLAIFLGYIVPGILLKNAKND